MSGATGGNNTPTTVFTTVPVDLFRMGNASGPRLDKIRAGKDVVTNEITLPSGEKKTMVLPTGGMSTFDVKNPSLSGIWWRIPAGVELPDTIRVIKDRGAWSNAAGKYITHYSFRPARMMTLEEYAEGLKEIAAQAVKEPKPINETETDEKEQKKKAGSK